MIFKPYSAMIVLLTIAVMIAWGCPAVAEEPMRNLQPEADAIGTVASRERGKAFFAAGDYVQALQFYKKAFSADPSDAETLKGIISSACRLEDYMTAYDYLQRSRDGKKISDPVVRELTIYLVQQMGSSVLAFQYAKELGVADAVRLEAFESDLAAERIVWEEVNEAKVKLERLLQASPRNVKAREKYILVLSKQYRMQDVWNQYRILESQEGSRSFEVLLAVADALTHLKRPQEAEAFYRKCLMEKPSEPFRPYLGLFDTYTTLRQWDKADQAWEKIRELIASGRLNWMEQHEAIAARGWYLMAQDRLDEAQTAFEAALREAGLDAGFRSGLAHVYYHRGWNLKALEQFRIAEDINPDEITSRVGIVQTLSRLDYNKEAAALASDLYRTYPYDLNVADLHEEMKVKNSPSVNATVRLIDESPGVTEYRYTLEGSMPVHPAFRIFSEILHMHAHENSDEGEFAFSWDRIGAGFTWVVLPGLTLTQEGSWDYKESADFGSTTRIEWNRSDHWKAAAGFESFSLDIPLRARVAGVQGKTGLAELAYHESDRRDYNLFFQSNWLDDGNYNPSFLLGMEQTVISRPDWKLQIGPEFYYARYSKDQDEVPYYSPMYAYSLVLKPVLQLTHYERYDRSFRSYIRADGGIYKQHRNGFYPTGGISYSQELNCSKTFKLNWMAGYGARVYDGRYSHVLELFFGVVKYF